MSNHYAHYADAATLKRLNELEKENEVLKKALEEMRLIMSTHKEWDEENEDYVWVNRDEGLEHIEHELIVALKEAKDE